MPDTTPKLGYLWKLYYCLAGIGGTPTWVEWTEVGTVQFPFSFGESDANARSLNGYAGTEPALLQASIEVEMQYVSGNVNYEAIMTAAMNRSIVGFAVMDGAIVPAAGKTSIGFWLDCKVTAAPIDADITKTSSVKMTIKPCWSANAPQRKTITTPP